MGDFQPQIAFLEDNFQPGRICLWWRRQFPPVTHTMMLLFKMQLQLL